MIKQPDDKKSILNVPTAALPSQKSMKALAKPINITGLGLPAIPPAVLPSMAWDTETCSKLLRPYNDTLTKIATQTNYYQEMFEAIAAQANSLAVNTLSSIQHNHLFGEIVQATISKLAAAVLEQLPPLIGEFWNDCMESAKTWGRYGWTLSIDSLFDLLDCAPIDLRQANHMARRRLTDSDINLTFDTICAAIPKRTDANDARLLFLEKRYKPCAMLLFSLVDCELIKSDKPGKAKGKRGKRGSKHGLNLLKQSQLDSSYYLFLTTNALSCLNVMEAQGDDFNRQAEGEINRHFLMHGMMYKPVTKTACFKIALLLLAILQVKRLASL